MEITLQKNNTKEVIKLLEDFFGKPFDLHFSWDAPMSSEYVLKQNNETSHYEVAVMREIEDSFYNPNESNILVVIQFMQDDDGMLLYEGDVIQLVDDELLIEQKSLALISILGKRNLVSLIKHI